MTINLIVAIDRNACIGFSGPHPIQWRQQEDMRHFKKLTENGVVIMGRNTYESLGRPLPNRVNIVISRNQVDEIPGVRWANSLEDAIVQSHTFFEKSEKIFLIGGAFVYNEAIRKGYVDTIYCTEVDTEIEDGDAFVYFEPGWETTLVRTVESDDKNEFQTKFYEMRKLNHV